MTRDAHHCQYAGPSFLVHASELPPHHRLRLSLSAATGSAYRTQPQDDAVVLHRTAMSPCPTLAERDVRYVSSLCLIQLVLRFLSAGPSFRMTSSSSYGAHVIVPLSSSICSGDARERERRRGGHQSGCARQSAEG